MFQALKAGLVSPESYLPRECDRTSCSGRRASVGWSWTGQQTASEEVTPMSLLLQVSAGWRRKFLFALVCSSASDRQAPQREDLCSELWLAGRLQWHLCGFCIFILILYL